MQITRKNKKPLKDLTKDELTGLLESLPQKISQTQTKIEDNAKKMLACGIISLIFKLIDYNMFKYNPGYAYSTQTSFVCYLGANAMYIAMGVFGIMMTSKIYHLFGLINNERNFAQRLNQIINIKDKKTKKLN